MSHVSTISTKISDLAVLKSTIKELGMACYEGQMIKGEYLGSGKKVDLVIDNKGDRNIGMVKNSDGFFSFEGDFYRIDRKNFTEKIIQRYTINKLKAGLKNYGATSINTLNLENGDVELTANF